MLTNRDFSVGCVICFKQWLRAYREIYYAKTRNMQYLLRLWMIYGAEKFKSGGRLKKRRFAAEKPQTFRSENFRNVKYEEFSYEPFASLLFRFL